MPTRRPGPSRASCSRTSSSMPCRSIASSGAAAVSRELYVDLAGGLVRARGGTDPPPRRWREHLAADGVTLAEGQLAEVGLAAAAWVAAAVRDLAARPAARHRLRDRRARAVRPASHGRHAHDYAGHRAGDDPFDAVGRQDITAHVDLTALDRAAHGSRPRAAGRDAPGGVPRRPRPRRAARPSSVRTRPRTLGDYAAARSAVARLLDPRHLGGFAVLAWDRDPAGAAADGSARSEPCRT